MVGGEAFSSATVGRGEPKQDAKAMVERLDSVRHYHAQVRSAGTLVQHILQRAAALLVVENIYPSALWQACVGQDLFRQTSDRGVRHVHTPCDGRDDDKGTHIPSVRTQLTVHTICPRGVVLFGLVWICVGVLFILFPNLLLTHVHGKHFWCASYAVRFRDVLEALCICAHLKYKNLKKQWDDGYGRGPEPIYHKVLAEFIGTVARGE